MKAWTFDDIPDQRGRVAIVTGANSGIGLETARMLAQKNATVVLACRNPQKGEAARASIVQSAPDATVELEPLDLGDLDSVAAFAARMRTPIDLLINNAGVMVPPLSRTKQGFELQFGTNHLGHFALTALLAPRLAPTGGRVVVVSSVAQNWGTIAFDDLQWEKRRYKPWLAYAQSKLANQLFAFELQRRLATVGSAVIVTSAHPGWTATELQRESLITRFFNPILAMKPPAGALPTLRAATDPDATGGSYWGPRGIANLKGPPVVVKASRAAHDQAVAARLFDESARLTGAQFPI